VPDALEEAPPAVEVVVLPGERLDVRRQAAEKEAYSAAAAGGLVAAAPPAVVAVAGVPLALAVAFASPVVAVAAIVREVAA